MMSRSKGDVWRHIYQEQVMQIEQVMARLIFAPVEATCCGAHDGKRSDRRWNSRRWLSLPARARMCAKGQADTIFELLAKFPIYGFNKSHAPLTLLVSYHTAYRRH